MAKIVSWNSAQLVEKARLVAFEYSKELSEELQAQIKTEQFAWPRKTKRRSGRVVDSPRDIKDTGEFLRSQRLRATDDGAKISWEVEYAYVILYGYKPNFNDDGTPELDDEGYQKFDPGPGPGRDWITPALDALPFAPNFMRLWSRFSVSGGGGATIVNNYNITSYGESPHQLVERLRREEKRRAL